MTEVQPPQKDIVYYDGDCELCRNFVSGVKNSSPPDNITFENIHLTALPDGIEKDSALREIHLLGADGKVLKNVDAIFKILNDQGRFLVLGQLARFPLTRPFFILGYRIVARYRHILMSEAFMTIVGGILAAGVVFLWFHSS